MPHWLTCKLTGRHEYTMWCQDGAMFLRCTNCGRRSTGWQIVNKPSAAGSGVERPISHRTAPPVARLSVIRPD